MKTVIRLRGVVRWSGVSLSAYAQRHVFVRRGTNSEKRVYAEVYRCTHTRCKVFLHYENKPIQIYWKFYHQKNENVQIKFLIFFNISAQNIDCGNSLEPPRRGGSNEYPQSMLLSRNKKNNVYPCKPQFYYIGGQHYIGMFCDDSQRVRGHSTLQFS